MIGEGATVLVTGGSGFIGRRLVVQLRERGFTVHAPGRAQLDLTSPDGARATIAALRPEAIVHLASAGVLMRDPDPEALMAAELAMADQVLAALPDGARLIHAGSMAEYGRSGRHAETSACTPHSAYGRAKLAASEAVLAAADRQDANACVARIFGAYGPGEAPRRLFPYLLARLAEGTPIPLSDGLQRRDFVHVDDVCAVLVALLRHAAPPPLINIGTGSAVSVRDAATRVAAEWGAEPDRLRFGEQARQATDEDLLEADVALLEASIGWTPVQHFCASQPVLPLLR